jgi:hypothetical protein
VTYPTPEAEFATQSAVRATINRMNESFLTEEPQIEDYWRAIILFGRNVIEIHEALHRIAKAGSVPALISLSRTRLGQGKYTDTHFSFASLDARFEVTQDKIEYCAMLTKAIQDAAAAQAAHAADSSAASAHDAVEVEYEPIPFPGSASS